MFTVGSDTSLWFLEGKIVVHRGGNIVKVISPECRGVVASLYCGVKIPAVNAQKCTATRDLIQAIDRRIIYICRSNK